MFFRFNIFNTGSSYSTFSLIERLCCHVLHFLYVNDLLRKRNRVILTGLSLERTMFLEDPVHLLATWVFALLSIAISKAFFGLHCSVYT